MKTTTTTPREYAMAHSFLFKNNNLYIWTPLLRLWAVIKTVCRALALVLGLLVFIAPANATSTSDGLLHNVGSTTTALASSLNPSVSGQNVTFTATVSPNTATGTVTFKDGSTTLGTGTLSSGSATYATTGLSVGSHTITAVYGGDANNTTSTSNGLSQVVSVAPISYCESISQQSNNLNIFNVTLGTLNNSSDCNSTGGTGSVIRQYSNYITTVAAPTLPKLNQISFSINVGNCQNYGQNSTSMWIDYNQDGNFDAPNERVYSSPAYDYSGSYTVSGTIIVPATALTGVTRMRVINAINGGIPMATACGVYNGGETEDYKVNIVAPVLCTGTPTPGNTITSETIVCTNSNFTLSLSNSLSAISSGYTYQWFNNAGAIAGATTATYIATTTAADNFHCKVTCTHSGQTGQSTPVAVGLKPFNVCYCSSYAAATDYSDIFNVTMGTLNNTTNASQTGGPGSILICSH